MRASNTLRKRSGYRGDDDELDEEEEERKTSDKERELRVDQVLVLLLLPVVLG